MKLSAPVYRLKRRAKLMARDENIPLHKALDRVARAEGFAAWSLLVAAAPSRPYAPDERLLDRLSDGDMLLLGARPGQGKTMLGLRLLLDAAGEGRRSVFFTLEYTAAEALKRLRALARDLSGLEDGVEVVTSEDISAPFIMQYLAAAPAGTVAVIDYLQLLDQRRDKPRLAEQISALHTFARQRGVILAFISQIDRSYDPQVAVLPGLADIRLPNRLDLGLFAKACFLHGHRQQFLHIPPGGPENSLHGDAQ